MKWEYLVVYVSETTVNHEGHEYDVQEYLDLVGQEGWELVTAVPVAADAATDEEPAPTTFTYSLYLKRELDTA
jgi:hypothetical protein